METQSPVRPLSPSSSRPEFDESAETEHTYSYLRSTSPEPGVDRPSLTSWPIPPRTDTSTPSDQLASKHSEHLYTPRQSTSQLDLPKHSSIRSGPRRSSDHVRTLSHVSERTDIVPVTVSVNNTTPPPQPTTPVTDTAPLPQSTEHVVPDSGQSQRRPHLFRNTSHMESDYVHMVLALDDISIFYNIAAGFFTWILLAGFVLFPGTFPNLQAKAEQRKLPVNSPVVLDAVTRVTSLPLFIVAWACTGIGIIGMLWLTWRWRRNYIWALNKIFMPGLLNSLAGLLSTLASIYGSQDGQITRPSRITLIVLVSCSGVCLILVAIYALWLVRRMKNKHDKEVGLERAGRYGEGITVDAGASISKRKKRKMKQKEQV
ncbi:hypothetical protein BJ165DRAFT_195991 [Panaeolus papilionaceus]|nr:hypothetical protein BJ165DRAFT_195991 [Panaeolus papilionaceus]